MSLFVVRGNCLFVQAQVISLEGEVIDATGKPVSGAKVYGYYLGQKNGRLEASTDDFGKFEVIRREVPIAIFVLSKDEKLAGVIVSHAKEEAITIEALPFISVNGQLVAGETGASMGDTEIIYRVEYKSRRGSICFHSEETKTDPNGFFEFKNVIVGGEASINLVTQRDPRNMALSFKRVLNFDVMERSNLELGRISPPPKRKLPTIEERATKLFVDEPLKPRFDLALELAEFSRRNILVVASTPNDPQLIGLLKLVYFKRKIRDWYAYRILAADPTNDQRLALESIGVKVVSKNLSMHVFGRDGALVESLKFNQLVNDEGQIELKHVEDFLAKHVVEPLDARVLLDDSLARAKREDKRVVLQFTTSSRSKPCDQLTLFFHRNRSWEKDYIWVTLDTRWENASEVVTAIHGELPRFLPWFAILNADGKKLVNSEVTQGPNMEFNERRNIGYPTKTSDKYYFKKMLMDTKIRMTEREIDELILALGQQ